MDAAQKASVAQLQLEAIEQMGRADEILAAVEPGLIDELRAFARTTWIDPRFMAGLLQGAYEVDGQDLVREAARRVVTKTSDHPLFRPIIQGTLRLFGKGPGPLFRTLPRAWRLVNRESGELEVEVAEDAVRVIVHGLPPVLDVQAFKESWVGTAQGILELAGSDGTADVDPRSGGFVVTARW